MKLIIRFVFLVTVLIGFFASATAHEVRPGSLKISETAPGIFEAVWKQPVLADKRLKIDPVFPENCQVNETNRSFGSNTLSVQMDVKCELKSGILKIEGLDRTLTDVFVDIAYQDGESRRELIKPASNQMDLSQASGAKVSEYIWIGVEHIIFGWDHLLFVLGLVLLVERRQIIGVATSFTLAHSITLALAAMGYLSIPIRPVEILIAMSIVLLAVEIIRKFRGQIGLSAQRPYLIGFLIGLIHGCGFASALSEIGLPKGLELLSLLLFNIGVELGQFAVVILFVLFLILLSKTPLNKNRITETAITYVIGGIAMFWVIDRLKDYIV